MITERTSNYLSIKLSLIFFKMKGLWKNNITISFTLMLYECEETHFSGNRTDLSVGVCNYSADKVTQVNNTA